MDDSPALHGITIVSLAVNLPGPLAVSRLVSLGAHAIKVEPPAGDPLVQVAPDYYAELTTGQQILALDLKDTDDRARLDELAARADVLLTSMRPRAAAALGIPDLVDRRGLVHVEIVGFDDERADVPGHDLTYQAAHGSLVPGSTPTVPVADVVGGERAVSAALAGLRQRDRAAHDGALRRGIVVRVSLDDAAAWAAGMARHGLTRPGGLLGGGSPFYRTYPTADGHIAVGAVEPHFATAIASLIGDDHDTLARAFAAESTAHWTALAAAHDLPLEPVQST